MLQPEMLSYAVYILAGLFLISLALLVRNEVRLRRLLRGKNARSIEDTLHQVAKELHELSSFRNTAEQRLTQTERELERSIQNVGIVRFNPFKGTSGSNQSFATAFLTKEGDGVVVSSIYSRERVSVFAKPVHKGVSEYDLSDEEREAITQAQEKTS